MYVRGSAILMGLMCLASAPLFAQEELPTFRWPGNAKMALSLSFDDGRPSQIDVGLPLLRKLGVTATMYVMPDQVSWKLEGWKQAVLEGHEIGNHTINHPCTENFEWVNPKNATENYTLERMHDELLEANKRIVAMLGVTPVSFAYSCGETSIGRGEATKSYRPLIAKLFRSGRGWLAESVNNPAKIDLTYVMGTKIDEVEFAEILPILETAKAKVA